MYHLYIVGSQPLQFFPSNCVLSSLITWYFHSVGDRYLYDTFVPVFKAMAKGIKSRNHGSDCNNQTTEDPLILQDTQAIIDAMLSSTHKCPVCA